MRNRHPMPVLSIPPGAVRRPWVTPHFLTYREAYVPHDHTHSFAPCLSTSSRHGGSMHTVVHFIAWWLLLHTTHALACRELPVNDARTQPAAAHMGHVPWAVPGHLAVPGNQPRTHQLGCCSCYSWLACCMAAHTHYLQKQLWKGRGAPLCTMYNTTTPTTRQTMAVRSVNLIHRQGGGGRCT
jgi:hypothetical protein